MRQGWIGTLGTLVLASALAGCGGGATVSKSQCVAGDWQTIGYRDGVNGLRSDQLLQHENACVPHGVVPDRTAYMAGWNQGVAEYCRPGNGFKVGEDGDADNDVCPTSQRDEFERGYQNGRQLYLARADVENLERTIDGKRERLSDVETQIVESASDQLNPMMTAGERLQHLSFTQRLVDEKADLERAIPELEGELAEKSAHLAMLQQSMASTVH